MSNMTRRQMLKGFALGSIVAASSGLATGCAPSSPLSDAGNANGTEKVYQFAKRTSEVSDRIPVETDVLVIGGGGELDKLRAMAGPTIEFKGGGLSDEEVRSYYLRAKGFLFPGEEDFGITPVEAQSAGTPVLAYGRGGACESRSS